MSRARRMAVAVAIAWLGVVALVVRAEQRRGQGTEYAVPIAGYDPRDLLSGHYLRFKYTWPVTEYDCGGKPCCLCLDRTRDGELRARQLSCDDGGRCRDRVSAEVAWGPGRYFIPEGRGAELEAALRDRGASLRVRTGPDGGLTILELLIDGRPWAEAVR